MKHLLSQQRENGREEQEAEAQVEDDVEGQSEYCVVCIGAGNIRI